MITKYFYTVVLILFAAVPNFGQDVQSVSKDDSKSTVEKKDQKEVAQTDSSEAGKDDADNQSDKTVRPKRKRIIDAETLKKRRSGIGNFFLKPFRAIAPKVMSRITRFEENREFEVIFGANIDFPIRPQFGSAVPGSGFGVGFTASTEDHISKDFRLVGSSLVTFSGYVENNAGIEITPRKFAKNNLKIELKGNQSIRPKEDFFGSGAGSFRSERTTFFRRQYGAKLSASYEANKHIKVGVFTEITHNAITDGKDSRGTLITTRFDSVSLPGLERNVKLLDSGVFVEFENLDNPDNPHSGWFTRLSFSNVDGLGRKDFGWVNYKFDSRVYIPIISKLRVLGIRFQGNFNDRKGGAGVPFFRLAKLGNDETLRGYELNRFHGLNSLHMNIEYRFKLMQGFTNEGLKGVDAIIFADMGQVYNDYNELNWNNMQTTWGGGFQFTTARSVAMAILYAKSPESGKVIFRFGKTF